MSSTPASADPYAHLRNIPTATQSGMLVIKACCDQEYRRIPILNRELTYDELCLMVHRLFREKLSANSDNLVIQYKDDEGDWISLTDDLDISHAVSLSAVVHIRVFDKKTLQSSGRIGEMPNLDPMGTELKQLSLVSLKERLHAIRSQIDAILTEIPEKAQEKLTQSTSKTDGESKKPDDPLLKPLSTSDMAEFLDANHGRRKSTVSAASEEPSNDQQLKQNVQTQQPASSYASHTQQPQLPTSIPQYPVHAPSDQQTTSVYPPYYHSTMSQHAQQPPQLMQNVPQYYGQQQSRSNISIPSNASSAPTPGSYSPVSYQPGLPGAPLSNLPASLSQNLPPVPYSQLNHSQQQRK